MQTTQTAAAPVELRGGVTIGLVTEGDAFLGLGQISVNGTIVRSGQVPLKVELSTPMGVRYDRYTLLGVEGDETQQRINLAAHGTQALRSEICDDYEDDLVFPTATPAAITDRLTWVLTAVETSIDGQPFTGFSYSLEFSSDTRKIHRMTFVATWELGGNIEGVTHLHQGQCNQPVYTGSVDTFFSSSVLKSIGGPQEGEDSLPNHSMQMCSRHGTLQAFDYQYSPAGILFGAWEKGEYVRTLLQKNRGETVLFVIDEHHVPYGKSAFTTPKQMLFAPVTDALRARDLWKMSKDHVQAGFERQWGYKGMALRTEDVIRESWLGNHPGALPWHGDRTLAPTELLYAMAEEWMPRIAANGIELVGFGPWHENDFTEYGSVCKRDGGIHGDLIVSSVCNSWRYRPAEYWGGMAAWKRYATRAHELGLKVGTWIGCHISRNAPVLREHPEWFNIGRTGKPNMASYSSSLGAAVNWNSGYLQWLMDDLKRWRDEAGLDYIFIDSLGNLGMLPINYNDNYSNNLDGMGKLIAELQKAGFEYVMNEGMGPFCPPRFGLGTHQTQAEGQNSLQWWLGNEDIADGTNPVIGGFPGLGYDESHAAAFRFFANNCLMSLLLHEDELPEELRIQLGYEAGGAEPRPDYYRDLMALWPQVRDQMFHHRRETLPEGKGVRWSGGESDVLWSYLPFTEPNPAGRAVSQVYPLRRNLGSGSFETDCLGVYIFD